MPAELSDRDVRARIRKLEQALEKEKTNNALLTAQLNQTNEYIKNLTVTKKRKIIKPKVDSNEKLISYQAIMGTQETADLEAEEEEKRA